MNVQSEERLIGLIAANDADASDWQAFEARAEASPDAWERLARSLRDELQMREALSQALESSDEVETQEVETGRFGGGHRLTAWPGWAVAAVLAIALGVSQFVSPTDPSGGGATTNRAGLNNLMQTAGLSSADDAYERYLELGVEEGRVLEQLPMLMVRSRVVEDAPGERTVEVVYVRQLLERARVQSAYMLSEDELGRRLPVRVDLTALKPETDL